MSDSPGASDEGPGTPTANGDADLGGQAMSANGGSAEGSTLFTRFLGLPSLECHPLQVLRVRGGWEKGGFWLPEWFRVE